MDSSLGSLSTLPPELRDQIFIECIANRSFGLLMTSKRLYTELQCHMKEKFTLKLHIVPSTQRSQIQIVHKPCQLWGASWNLIWATTPHVHSPENLLANMPLSMFGRLRVYIDAPDPDDPGQVVRIFKSVSQLVAILSPAWMGANCVPGIEGCILHVNGMGLQSLPPIEVILRDTSSAAWSSSNTWNQSLQSYRQWLKKDQTGFIEYSGFGEETSLDVEYALHPFMRLRNVRSFNITFPAGTTVGPRLTALVNDIRQVTVSQVPFGLAWDDELESGVPDDVINIFNSCNFLWLDHLLDDLPGDTANRLREERAYSWCQKYELQIYHALWGALVEGSGWTSYEGGACERFDDELLDKLKADFDSRWWTKRRWDAGYQRKSLHKFWRTANGPFIHLGRWGVSYIATPYKIVDTDCRQCVMETAFIFQSVSLGRKSNR